MKFADKFNFPKIGSGNDHGPLKQANSLQKVPAEKTTRQTPHIHLDMTVGIKKKKRHN